MIEYSDFSELKTVKLYYETALKKLESKLKVINDEFDILGNNPIDYIKIRMKSLSSITDKLKRKKLDINANNTFILKDVVGARIICDFIDDVYKVIDKIKTEKDIVILEEKDYIRKPKESGYRGYHIIICIPITIDGIKKNINAEIQIRTKAMDFWASSEHKLNYKKLGLSLADKLELKKLADEVWNMDIIMNSLEKKVLINNDLIFGKVNRGINIDIIRELLNWRMQNEI